MTVPNSLIYVDKNLVVPLAAKLLGSTITISKGNSVDAGFDWFLQSRAGVEYSKEIQTNIVDFFAEDIFELAYDKIKNKMVAVKDYCSNVQTMQYTLSEIVSIKGILEVPGVQVGEYNPFAPPQISIPRTYRLNDMDCFIAKLSYDGFTVPVYFPISSKEYTCYCMQKPVEVVGVIKWSPTYTVNSYAMNQTLLGVALLLQR